MHEKADHLFTQKLKDKKKALILSCAQEYFTKYLNFLYSFNFLEALVVTLVVQ